MDFVSLSNRDTTAVGVRVCLCVHVERTGLPQLACAIS